MLKRGVFTRFAKLRERNEDGVALASVVIVSFVVLIIAASLSMTLVNSTNLTADNKSQVNSFSSAESGIAAGLYGAIANACVEQGEDPEVGYEYEIYRSSQDELPSGLDDPHLLRGCPQDGDKYVAVLAKGSDARGDETEILEIYRWTIRERGTAEGAVVANSGLSNISALAVYNADGDVLIQEGDMNCNNSSQISGDVIIMNGTIDMSNYCHIHGSLYVAEGARLHNYATVDGDVYVKGNFETSNVVSIGGDLRVTGTVSLRNGTTIGGSVTAMGTGLSSVIGPQIQGSFSAAGPVDFNGGAYVRGNLLSTSTSAASSFFNAAVGGDVFVNGWFSQLQKTAIGGSIIAAKDGARSSIAPDVTAGTFIRLGGPLSTWGSGPYAPGGVQQKNPTAERISPSFEFPAQLTPGFFQWRDYDYDPRDWRDAGYEIVAATNCDFQNNASARSFIESFTTPTLIDVRNCGQIRAYGVTLNIKTDITLLANKIDNAQQMVINSAPGTGAHEFSVLIPDQVLDGKPTCGAGQGDISIFGLKMSSDISGVFYTPCKVSFGGTSVFNGQIYAGIAENTGNSSSKLNFMKIYPPGFPLLNTEDIPAAFESDADVRFMPTLAAREEN